MKKIISIGFGFCTASLASQSIAVQTMDIQGMAQNATSTATIVSAIVQQATQQAANSVKMIAAGDTQTGKTVSAISAQTNVQTETARHIAESQEQAAVDHAKQAENVSATVGAKPPASGGCTGRLTGTGVAQTGGDGAKYGAAKSRWRNKSVKRATYSGRQLAQVLENHTAKYCTEEDVRNGLCKEVTPLGDADVDSKTLFSGAGGDQTAGGESLTFSDRQVEASNDLLGNLTGAGDTPRALTPAELKTTAGQEYEALRTVYIARTSPPSQILQRVQDRRIATENSKEIYKRLMEDTTDKTGYFKRMIEMSKDSSGVRPAGERISELELLKYEVDRRYANEKWHSQIQQETSSTPLLKEIALMQALQLKFEYEHFRDREMANATMALQALDSVKREMLPRLWRAEKAATSGR